MRHRSSNSNIRATSFAVAIEDAQATTYKPKDSMGEPLQMKRGEVEAALAEAHARLAETYTTPNEHPCALEPHATWRNGTARHSLSITPRNGSWAIKLCWPPPSIFLRSGARYLPIRRGHVRLEKGATGAHVILAALAAMRLNRPVKIVLSRPQVADRRWPSQ